MKKCRWGRGNEKTKFPRNEKFLFDNEGERKRRKKRKDGRSWWCVGRALNKRASILGLVSQLHLLRGIPHQTGRASTSQEENTVLRLLIHLQGWIKSKLWFPCWCRSEQLRNPMGDRDIYPGIVFLWEAYASTLETVSTRIIFQIRKWLKIYNFVW